MAETKPRSEQIRFISDKTGENILDTYLEACERVGIPLGTLIDVIFDSVGNVNPNFIQFRLLNPSASVYTLQFRSGIYIDPNAGWQDVSSPVFQDLINTANTAVTNATAQATLSSQWASQTNGIVASTDYSSKAWAIGGTGVTNTAARGAAKEWATKTTGTVDTSEYAAKAWAIGGTGVTSTATRGSAKDWAILGTSPDGSSNLSAKTYATNAGTSASNAATSEANALTYMNNALAAANGMQFRTVRIGTTANITLSAPQTIDGVAVVAGNRVLVKNQSTASQNGIYQVNAGAWTRTTDSDTWDELVGSVVLIQEGSTLADTAWICTSDAGGTLGTTNVTYNSWSQAILAGTIDGTKLVSSIALAGSPTTTTQAINDNSTKLATTAYVDRSYNGMPQGTTDLNTFLTGCYLTPNTGVSNLPTGWSQGRHIVETFDSSGYTRQFITGASPMQGRGAIRSRDGSGNWSAWREMAQINQADWMAVTIKAPESGDFAVFNQTTNCTYTVTAMRGYTTGSGTATATLRLGTSGTAMGSLALTVTPATTTSFTNNNFTPGNPGFYVELSSVASSPARIVIEVEVTRTMS